MKNEIIIEYKNKTKPNRDIINDSYKRLFNTNDGKVVIEDLLRFYFKKSHKPGDPYETAFREGRRSMVGEIINRVYNINEKQENEE